VIFTEAGPASMNQSAGPRRMRPRAAYPVALAGGLLLAASFPPAGIWPLAFLAPAMLMVTLTGQRLRTCAGIGLLFGLGFFIPLLSWVINLAWYAWVALAVASAVIFAALTLGQRILLRLPMAAWPPAIGGWWVACEALRDRWPWGGFPWGRLAMSQATAPSAGWITFAGAPWVTFLVALTSACLACVALRRSWRMAIALAVALGVTMSGSLLRAAVVPSTSGDPTAEVAAIQGDVPHARTLTQLVNDTVVTQNHAAATIELAHRVAAGYAPAPDLVIWPENSTDLDPTVYPYIGQAIRSALNAIDRPVLVGAVLQNPLRNAGQLWLPGKGPVEVYLKRRLVPFGEVIPLRGLLSKITSLTALQPINFTAGTKAVIFHIGKIRLGDVICYEIGFDDLVQSDVNDGANLLAMQTNDATFERDGQTGETLQQLDMARLRAIESDRAVVVASTTGVSAIISPTGQLITRSGTWQPAILEARVPLISWRTPADRLAQWPEWLMVAFTCIGLGLAWLRSRRGIIS
jgi:apolipoprotein N-acyltransferase